MREKAEIQEGSLRFSQCTIWIQLIITAAEIKRTVYGEVRRPVGQSVIREREREILTGSFSCTFIYFSPQFCFFSPHHWTSNTCNLICNYYDYHFPMDPWWTWNSDPPNVTFSCTNKKFKKHQKDTTNNFKKSQSKEILPWWYLVIARPHRLEVQVNSLLKKKKQRKPA